MNDLRSVLADVAVALLAPKEHERARAALALIQARGYDRGRELVAILDRLLAAD